MERGKFKKVFWTIAIIAFVLGFASLLDFFDYGKGLNYVLMYVFFGISEMSLFVLAFGLSLHVKEPKKVFSLEMLRSILREMRIPARETDGLGALMKRIARTEANAIVATLLISGFEISEKYFNGLLHKKFNGWDITTEHDAAAREFKKIGLKELDAIAKKDGRILEELNGNELALIIKAANALNVPVTLQEELKDKITDTENKLESMKSRLEAKAKNKVSVRKGYAMVFAIDVLTQKKRSQEALLTKVESAMPPKKGKKPSDKKKGKKK